MCPPREHRAEARTEPSRQTALFQGHEQLVIVGERADQVHVQRLGEPSVRDRHFEAVFGEQIRGL